MHHGHSPTTVPSTHVVAEGDPLKLVKKIHNNYRGLGGVHGSALGTNGIENRLTALNELHPMKGAMLVDIGCGDGAFTKRLAANFDRVLAIDVEPDRIQLFQDSPPPANTEVMVGDAGQLPLENASVDVVTAIEVVEHLGEHFDRVVGDVSRVLRPGGVFAVTTPNRWWPMEQHGWVVGNYRMSGILFPFLTWIRPIHKRLSDASAFSVKELNKRMATHGLQHRKHTYMWPPLDGHPGLRPAAQKTFGIMRKIGLGGLAQTSVVTYVRV